MINYKLKGQPLIDQIFKDIFNTDFSDKLISVDGYDRKLKLAYIYYGMADYHPNHFMSYRFNEDV